MFLNGNTQPWLHIELLEELKKVLVPGSYSGPVESISGREERKQLRIRMY